MNSEKIGIIGGGVAGISVALALASKGISSEVFESRAKPGNIDRGDVLHQRSLALLQNWGLPHLESAGAKKLERFTINSNTGKLLFQIDFKKLYPEGAFFSLGHKEIEQMLWTEATNTPLINIHAGTSVKQLILDGTRIKGIETNKEKHYFDLVIACDGASSKTRKQYYRRIFSTDYREKFINCQFSEEKEQPKEGAYVIGKAGVLIFVSLPDGLYRVGIQLEKKKRLAAKNIVEKICRTYARFQPNDFKLLGIKTYNLKRVLVKEKADVEGLFLAGDSFHTFHPTLGYGMNAAIADADILASAIANITLKTFREKEQFYLKKRLKEVRLIFSLTHQFGQLGSSTNSLVIFLRNSFLRVFNKADFAKKYFLKLFKMVN